MRNPSRDSPGARRISPEHVARLRAIVARVGSVAGARTVLTSSCELVEDALTGRVFRRTTAESLEAKIDQFHLSARTSEGRREEAIPAASLGTKSLPDP
jgi:hypothetical protein